MMEQREYFEKIDRAYAQPDTVESVLRELVQQSREEYGAQDPFYASMLSELGGYLRSAGQLLESEACFARAVNILKTALGEWHPDYATALNNLAGTHRMMGRLNEAGMEFAECLAIYGETVGQDHMLYAACLNNLSLLSLDKGDVSAASELMGQASAIMARHPDCRDEYATALANLAGLYLRLERYNEAEENLHKAAEIYENEVGVGTPHYYMILNSLGIARLKQGDAAGAAEHFRRAAEKAKEMFGEEHPEYQKLLRHIAIAERGENERS